MASGIYTCFKGDCFEKQVDIGDGGDVLKVALLNATHAFAAANTIWGDISANEISGTGYTAGGQVLAGQAVTEGTTTKFDGTDVAWTGASFSAWHIVIYDVTNTNSLIASWDMAGEQKVTAATFTASWHADGILTLGS